ncbi:hypothetical protein SpV1-C74p04 [Spiroplasma phage C74]|uniref:Uncharacterized protein ORF15 n=1 Tax=Spiroplasma virus SpV1-C74 TaxID=185959 RepID=ORF15_SPV1C|nr:hypothetical protein SpV1-C74p04 [Spiroplasma phage C74]Q88417.1 RecName: Full=Uncharacterized protein ORF15 [Spiroplasma phage C74]AAA85010.1 ORF15 [Spiroplasma phage C74]
MKIKILKFLKRKKWWEILVYILVVGFGFALFIGSIYDKWDKLIKWERYFILIYVSCKFVFLIWISLMYFIYN